MQKLFHESVFSSIHPFYTVLNFIRETFCNHLGCLPQSGQPYCWNYYFLQDTTCTDAVSSAPFAIARWDWLPIREIEAWLECTTFVMYTQICPLVWSYRGQWNEMYRLTGLWRWVIFEDGLHFRGGVVRGFYSKIHGIREGQRLFREEGGYFSFDKNICKSSSTL